MLRNYQRITINTNWKIMQFNLIWDLYLSPEKMKNFGIREHSLCPRCGINGADFIHMIWGCAVIKVFWAQIFDCLEEKKIIKNGNDLTFIQVILGGSGLGKSRYELLLRVFLCAKNTILRNWMSNQPPLFVQWVKLVDRVRRYEFLEAKITENKTDRMIRLWEGWE